MDVNLAFVNGQLALEPHLEVQLDGTHRARLLVYVRCDRRSRFDVVPVVVPGPVIPPWLATLRQGDRVAVAGPVQRVCSIEPWAPAGRLEVIADSIVLPDVEDAHPAG